MWAFFSGAHSGVELLNRGYVWTQLPYVLTNCSQYGFTSLYSQPRYIKVPIENSPYFSFWIIDGRKEDWANLISELCFKENEHGSDSINISFLWFLAMYTFDISMYSKYKSIEITVKREQKQSMQINTFP